VSETSSISIIHNPVQNIETGIVIKKERTVTVTVTVTVKIVKIDTHQCCNELCKKSSVCGHSQRFGFLRFINMYDEFHFIRIFLNAFECS